MVTHQSVLTPTWIFSPSSEVATMRQTDGAVYKLKPRLFHKSTHLRVHSVDFHPSVNHAWHILIVLYYILLTIFLFYKNTSVVWDNFESLIYPFLNCLSINLYISSLSSFDNRYTFLFLGTNHSFTSITWFHTFLLAFFYLLSFQKYKSIYKTLK